MQRSLLIIFRAGLLWACLLLFSCGGEPFTYSPSNEVKPGPGLFSGPDGEFTVIGPKAPVTEDGKTSAPQKKAE